MIVPVIATFFCFASILYASPVHDENGALVVGHLNNEVSGDIPNLARLLESGNQVAKFAEGKFGNSLNSTPITKLWFIMALYNNNEKKEDENNIENPNSPPDLCKNASLDAVTRTQDGSTYVFKGDYYWKVDYNVIAPGYPRKISDDWCGLEGNLDAAFTSSEGMTFFFKGDCYWSFQNKNSCSRKRVISDGFKGIPDNLDAALTWGENNKPYFFKGSQYWLYEFGEDPPVKAGYPAPLSAWKGLPSDGIDAAVLWDNNKSYFFKGQKYYLFDDKANVVSKGYPAPTAPNWFSCKCDCTKS